MKDYEHWDFCNKAMHAVGWSFRNVSIIVQSQWWQGRPSPSATTWGRCAEGACQKLPPIFTTPQTDWFQGTDAQGVA